MGDQNTIIGEAELRHILKRTGFGPAAKDMKRAKKMIGLTRGDAADYLLGLKRKVLQAKGKEAIDVHRKWVKHLTKGKTPFLDKTVLFFHDHFSVQASVVENYPEAITQHLRMHYTYALGNFKDYCKAVNKDPAMMVFLDTVLNHKEIPNENYPRELCELFTLGVYDLNGVENYTQKDVVQIARAFTGWSIDQNQQLAYLESDDHDTMAEYPSRGPKVLFDNAHGFPSGGESFTMGGEGENEIDEVIEILFAHLDSDGMNTVARRTAFRLLEFLCYAKPAKAIVDAVVADSSFELNWSIDQLIRAIVVHDVFYETMAPAPHTALTKKSVKWPIDYIVGTLRMLKMKPRGKELEIPGGGYDEITEHETNMGQLIGEPPSVFGWDWEGGWISSSTLLARYTFARDLINARTKGRFKPLKHIDNDLTDPGEIVDAITAALNIADQLTAAERTELIEYLTDNGANPILNLDDDVTVDLKIHGAFGLAMQSAAFQLH
jgi:uncharacterized protein (DUF1800 family)